MLFDGAGFCQKAGLVGIRAALHRGVTGRKPRQVCAKDRRPEVIDGCRYAFCSDVKTIANPHVRIRAIVALFSPGCVCEEFVHSNFPGISLDERFALMHQ